MVAPQPSSLLCHKVKHETLTWIPSLKCVSLHTSWSDVRWSDCAADEHDRTHNAFTSRSVAKAVRNKYANQTGNTRKLDQTPCIPIEEYVVASNITFEDY